MKLKWGNVQSLRLPSLAALANGVTLLLVVAVGVSAAQMTWRLWPVQDKTAAPAAVPISPVAAVKPALGGQGRQLASLHLFGESETVKERAPIETVNAPTTRLRLTLRGVFSSGDAEKAMAIIADSSNKELPYRVGDSVPGGATIKQIAPDRVLLERSGRLETLLLPSERKAQFNSKINTSRRTELSTASQLGKIRQQIVKNPFDAGKYLTIEPVMEGESVKGYRVHPKQEHQLFSAAGLKTGDVVTRVNGVPVGDPNAMGKLMHQLTTADRFTLQVENNGKPRMLNVRLD